MTRPMSPRVARALTEPPRKCATCGHTSCGCSDSEKQAALVEKMRDTDWENRPIPVVAPKRRGKRS